MLFLERLAIPKLGLSSRVLFAQRPFYDHGQTGSLKARHIHVSAKRHRHALQKCKRQSVERTNHLPVNQPITASCGARMRTCARLSLTLAIQDNRWLLRDRHWLRQACAKRTRVFRRSPDGHTPSLLIRTPSTVLAHALKPRVCFC